MTMFRRIPPALPSAAFHLARPLFMLALTTLAATEVVSAETIAATDWKVQGDHKLTLDSNTGLEWLDIDQTLNKSYERVTFLLGTGQTYEGFRYATEQEFTALVANAGILDYSHSYSYFAEAVALQALLGYSYYDGTYQTQSFGIFSDPALANFERRGADLGTLKSGIKSVDFFDQTNQASANKGSWLVRLSPQASVPEIDPSSFGSAIAMLLGSLGLVERRSRRGVSRSAAA